MSGAHHHGAIHEEEDNEDGEYLEKTLRLLSGLRTRCTFFPLDEFYNNRLWAYY